MYRRFILVSGAGSGTDNLLVVPEPVHGAGLAPVQGPHEEQASADPGVGEGGRQEVGEHDEGGEVHQDCH